MAHSDQQIPAFVDKVIDFPDGKSFEVLKPLTDYRKCHDGVPLEARIVFTCRQVKPEPDPQSENEFVLKVKVQVPTPAEGAETEAVEGPSTTTKHELKALKIFTNANSVSAPHTVSFKKDAQKGPTSPLPGGYLTYMVMTKMPGRNLLDGRYWDMTPEVRQEITSKFLKALRSMYEIGIEPVDCGLRNVIWDNDTKRCTIVDFELWRSTEDMFGDEVKELERWGLAKRKPPISWWAEWKIQGF